MLEGGFWEALPGFKEISHKNSHRALSSRAETKQGRVWGEPGSQMQHKHSARTFHTNNNPGSKNRAMLFFFSHPQAARNN